MKKFLNKIFVMVTLFNSLLFGYCYADEIDPMYSRNPIPRMPEPDTNNVEEAITIIAIGVVVILISAIAIIILKKSGKKENK